MIILGTESTQFSFPEPGPDMFTVTCVNHPEAQYLTKGPGRNLHFIGWGRLKEGRFTHPEFGYAECPCSFSDLRVVEPDQMRRERELADIERLLDPAGTYAGPYRPVIEAAVTHISGVITGS